MRKYILFIALITATLACSFSTDSPTPDSSLLRTQVAIELTQTAIAQPAPNIKVTTPTAAVAAPSAIPPKATAAAVANGSISGALGYPASGIPPLAVYAISKDDAKKFNFVLTTLNQNSYTIKDLTPGVYVVVAYAIDYKVSGGWTKAVPCGLTVSCTDHSLTPVTVKSGENVTGVDIKDWYAPEGTFPPRPTK